MQGALGAQSTIYRNITATNTAVGRPRDAGNIHQRAQYPRLYVARCETSYRSDRTSLSDLHFFLDATALLWPFLRVSLLLSLASCAARRACMDVTVLGSGHQVKHALRRTKTSRDEAASGAHTSPAFQSLGRDKPESVTRFNFL